jgi:hypothetical protein
MHFRTPKLKNRKSTSGSAVFKDGPSISFVEYIFVVVRVDVINEDVSGKVL